MKRLRFGITGGTGMLGARVVEFLTHQDIAVRCLVRKSSKIARLKELGVDLFYGDIEDRSSLSSFAAGIDVCLHLAAQVGYSDKSTYYKANVTGTDNLCRAILDHSPGCKLVYCSSIASLRVNRLLGFLSTEYARSKRMAESRVAHHIGRGLRADIVYPGVIYGPGDVTFVPRLSAALRAGKLFLVSGGERNAPLIYIDDLCELLFRAGTAPGAGNRYLGVQRLELGIHDFIRLLAQKTNTPPPASRYPKALLMPIAMGLELAHRLFRTGKQPPLTMRVVDALSVSLEYDKHCMDNEKLAWTARTGIGEGLDNALAWLRKANGVEKDRDPPGTSGLTS